MPIRFRCEHCHQLLGIARRKSGTRVECPTCHALVLVPNEDQEDSPAPAVSSQPVLTGREEPVFERSDFQELLQGPAGGEPALGAAPLRPAARQPAPAAPRPTQLGGEIDVERLDLPAALEPGAAPGVSGAMSIPPGTVGGYLLTPFRASLLVTLVIVLMAVSFVAGLLVGRYVL